MFCRDRSEDTVRPRADPVGPGGEKYRFNLSLAATLGGGWLFNATPPPLHCTPGRTDRHCVGSWVCPRAGLDGCGKSRPHRNSIPDRSESLYRLYIRLTYFEEQKICCFRQRKEAGVCHGYFNPYPANV